MVQNLILILKGVIIGISNAIPGISGGTIAYVLRVYDFMINGLALNLKYILANFTKYLLLFIGILLGVFIFSFILDQFIYDSYPLVLNLAFAGLIIGSLSFVFKQTKLNLKATNPKDLALIGLGVFIVVLPLLFSDLDNPIITTLTILDGVGLFFAGMVGAFAMIIPGISGSFVMLALGYYRTIINAIAEFLIIIQIPVIIGALIGLIFGAKLIKYLLTNYSNSLYKLIFGFVVGSLLTIDLTGFGFNLQSLIGSLILIGFAYLGNQIVKTKSA